MRLIMSFIDSIKSVIEHKVQDLGFELFDLRWFSAGTKSILRVTIDSSKSVTIKDCEIVSRELSEILDSEQFSQDRFYTLEVSSPGIDRPLKTERDYKRIIGHPVLVHLSEPVEGKKSFEGEVVKCENGILVLNFNNKMVEIPLSIIYSGKEEIRFK
ncbi:MAG: ribosome maturation factor RimP [Fibrobacter sp.]|nr:ribosome maturation factor RimP [Fibrobacter sp.]